MQYLSLINGEFTDKISVLDRGLFYGDGFFETMRWKYFYKQKKLKVEFWKRHLKRLKNGCDATLINFPSIKLIEGYRRRILQESISKGLASGILKIIVTRGSGGRGYKFDKNMKANIIFLVFPEQKHIENNYEKGVNLKFCNTKLNSETRVLLSREVYCIILILEK